MTNIQSDTKYIIPLRMAGEGVRLRIISWRRGKGFTQKLLGIGLNVGSEIEVVQNDMHSPVLIFHNGTKLFLGGGMAQKINVALI